MSQIHKPTLRKFCYFIASSTLLILFCAIGASKSFAFSIYPRLTSSPQFTFRLESAFTNKGADWVARAREAAQTWNSTGKFTFTENSSSANYVNIGDLNYPTLAVTYRYDSGPYTYQFRIWVDPDNPDLGYYYTGTGSVPSNQIDLRSVLRHEFGHATGLAHSSDSSALMNAKIDPGQLLSMATDDLNGLGYMYDLNYTGPSPEKKNPRYASLPASLNYNYDDHFDAVGYTGTGWSMNGTWQKAINQTIAYNNTQQARAWFAFSGNKITRFFTMAPNRGKVKIFIDGADMGEYNDKATSIHWQAAKTWNLSSDAHIIEIRGNEASTYFDSDAFQIGITAAGSGTYDDRASEIEYDGGALWWAPYNGTGPYADTVRYSSVTDTYVRFTFTGSSIKYCYTKAYNRGIASVVIDGKDKGNLDLYSAATQWKQCTTYSSLGSGIHTIHISVTGTKNASATDKFVDIDRFVVN